MDRDFQLRTIALQAFYAHESPLEDNPSCIVTGCRNNATYDCQDCDAPGLYCKECLLKEHQFRPFHRVHEWNGEHLVTRTLMALGLIVHIGHSGQPCIHLDDSGGPQVLTIMDVNGVHEVRIAWCRCFNAMSFAEQLLSRKLFPASIVKPRTAFTFRALKLFHMVHHVGRTTPWDFAGTMHRLTDNVDPASVPVSQIYVPRVLSYIHAILCLSIHLFRIFINPFDMFSDNGVS